MNIERTKIFGAATATVLCVMVLGLGAESIFHMDDLEEAAYSVEVPASLLGGGGGTPVEEPVINMAALIATADVAKGENVAKKCIACHAFEKGGANKTGPGLWGVLGADIAAAAGYDYSNALQEKEGAWDWEKLGAFLEKPRQWAPGTKMGFAGLSKPQDRADIMAWMNAQSDAPIEAPEVIEEEPQDPIAEEIVPTEDFDNNTAVSEPGDGQAVPATGEDALDPNAPGPDGLVPESPEEDMGGAEPDAVQDGDEPVQAQPEENEEASDEEAGRVYEENLTPDTQLPLEQQSPDVRDPENPDAGEPTDVEIMDELPENAT